MRHLAMIGGHAHSRPESSYLRKSRDPFSGSHPSSALGALRQYCEPGIICLLTLVITHRRIEWRLQERFSGDVVAARFPLQNAPLDLNEKGG